ncbi:hypothetical protein JK202_10865 [Gluconobacter sp. Dm-62]|uniref:hypothetical protein n=1 Tax=Gluconobacter sp. Dm-62 TaxID=2799804 RepID=UPI001B8CEAD6|nr:hypothetical protein [Gluconobacter sp. Dm-62]MBS1103510.1 hypothetical protein [Gluconobacter sp. Dm-62]
MKKILLSLICCGAFGVAHADPALMRGFVPGGNGVLDAKSKTPSGQPLFDGSGRPTGNMSPVALYSGFVSAATVTSPGAYAPVDLPLTLTVAGNALGQTAQLVPTGYTVTSATVVAAGNACPASSVFTLASTGTKVIVSDGNGLSGSVVTVSVGGTAASAADVPANPVTLTSSTSGCTPPQFTLGWGLAGASVQLPGWGYTAAPGVTAPASSLAGGVAASVLAQVQTGPVNLAQQPVTANASAASAQAAYGGSVPRTLSQKWGDRYNLADLGAKLDGSASDAATIQSIYDALPNNSLVEVPKGSQWDGKLANPDPNKYVTWLFDGHIGGYYPSPGGDGDVNITLNSGFYAGAVSKASKHFNTPASAFFWNMNPGFCGPYCSNYAQMPALGALAISGPTSSGNTSAINAELDSYGTGPSSNYDVGLNLFVKKMGQNSVWGIVDDIQDFSGKSPGAFGAWNEFDLWANGDDIPTFDPSYGKPQSGHRSMFYLSMSSLGAANYWQANQGVTAWSTGQYDRPESTRIMVGVNGTLWLWYAQKAGTTGGTQPNFPAPTEAVASYDGTTTLTISSVVSGTISIGDYVTAAMPVHPFQIVKQLTGTAGGAGTYQIALDDGDGGEAAFSAEGVFIAPRMTDGTAVWQFGERFNQTIGSVLWLTGGSGDAVDVAMGGTGLSINGAWVDAGNNPLGPTAAVIRAAAGQTVVDFTSNNTLAGRNQHTLSYQNGLGMTYKSGTSTAFGVMDDGSQVTPHTTPSAAGSTIDDATVVDGPFIVVSVGADAQGAKVGTEMGNEGTSHTIANGSSHTLNVYPINGQWAFIGKAAGTPIVLPAYASVKLTTVSNYNHTIYAEYHPPAP